jgi:Mg-chelatase subunit ChlD
MRKDYTDITAILDRSGSMTDGRKDMEAMSGYNSFIAEQKKVGGKCCITLILFDSENRYQVVYAGKDVQEVPELTSSIYFARGMTPYLDCLGRAIVDTGKRLEETQEQDRPDKVIFVIITDGLENASTNFTKSQIREKIEHQQTKYGWDFLFLGADFDAVAEGTSMGIQSMYTATMDSSRMGDSIRTTSSNIKAYRSSGDKSAISYTKAQREELMKKKSSTSPDGN